MNNVSSFWDKSNCYFAEVVKNYDPFHPNQVLVQSIPVPAVHYSNSKESREESGQAWVSLISNIVGSKNNDSENGNDGSSGYGLHVLPEVGSIVVVLRFDDGTKSSGQDFVLGTFWHHNMVKPVVSDPVKGSNFEDEETPNLQSFTTADGTTFLIDETKIGDGNSTFSIYNPYSKFKVVVENDKDKNTNLTIEVPGDIDMNTADDFSIYGAQTVEFDGKKGIDITADGDNVQFSSKEIIKMTSEGDSKFNGKEIHLNKQTSSSTVKPPSLKNRAALSLLELGDVATKFEPTKSGDNSEQISSEKEESTEIVERIEVPLTICYVEDSLFTLLTPFTKEESFGDKKFEFSTEQQGGPADNNKQNEGSADNNKQDDDILGRPDELLSLEFDCEDPKYKDVLLNKDDFSLYECIEKNYRKSLDIDFPKEVKAENNEGEESGKEPEGQKNDGKKPEEQKLKEEKRELRIYGRRLKLQCYIELKYKIKKIKKESNEQNSNENDVEYQFDMFDIQIKSEKTSKIRLPKEFIDDDVHYAVTDVLEYGFNRAQIFSAKSIDYCGKTPYKSSLFGNYTRCPNDANDVMNVISENFEEKFLKTVLNNYNVLNDKNVCIDNSEVVIVLKVKRNPENKIYVRFNYVAPDDAAKSKLIFYSSEAQLFDLESNVQNAFMSMIGKNAKDFKQYQEFVKDRDKSIYRKGVYVKNHQWKDDFAVFQTSNGVKLIDDWAEIVNNEGYDTPPNEMKELFDKEYTNEYGTVTPRTVFTGKENENVVIGIENHSNFFLTYPPSLKTKFCIRLRESLDEKDYLNLQEYDKIQKFNEKANFLIYMIMSARAYSNSNDDISIEPIQEYVKTLTYVNSSTMFSEIMKRQQEVFDEKKIEKIVDSNFFDKEHPLDVFLLADVQAMVPVYFLQNDFVFSKADILDRTNFEVYLKAGESKKITDAILKDEDRYAFSYSTLENSFSKEDIDDIFDRYNASELDIFATDDLRNKPENSLNSYNFYYHGSKYKDKNNIDKLEISGRNLRFIPGNIPYLLYSGYAAYEKLLLLLYFNYCLYEKNQIEEDLTEDTDFINFVLEVFKKHSEYLSSGIIKAYYDARKTLFKDLLERNSTPYFVNSLYDRLKGSHSVRIIGKDDGGEGRGTYKPVLENIFKRGETFSSDEDATEKIPDGDLSGLFANMYGKVEEGDAKAKEGDAKAKEGDAKAEEGEHKTIVEREEIETRINKYFGRGDDVDETEFKKAATGIYNISWDQTVYGNLEKRIDFRIANFYTSFWRIYEFGEHTLYNIVLDALFLVPFGKFYMVNTELK